jgi:hypothetical protein
MNWRWPHALGSSVTLLALALSASAPVSAQSAFNRADAFDFRPQHNLRVYGNSLDEMYAQINSDSDFRLFKIRVNGIHNPVGVGLWVYRINIDMNNDGIFELSTTTNGSAVSWTYPEPGGLSATHTIRIVVELQDIQRVCCSRTVYQTITILPAPRVYVDTEGDAFVQLRNEDCTNKIPLLLVEGYDVADQTGPDTYYLLTWDLINSDLIPNGYEVFILNFHYANDDMRHNAAVVQQALQKIRDLCPSYEIALAGLSMGGVISRYALAQTEGAGGEHRVGLFISFDSPQQQAHANPDLQDYIRELSTNEGIVGQLKASLQSPAAVQMLGYNTYDPSGSVHEGFYGELNALNGDGYPHRSYNAAISNGNFNATWGFEDVGRHLLDLKLWVNGNGLPVIAVPAVELDCGTGSKQVNFATRKYGDIFSFQFFGQFNVNLDYELNIFFNPVYMPTWSALDLQDVVIDDISGDIRSYSRSKFDDFAVQASPLMHNEVSDISRAKIASWVNKTFNVTVNYSLLAGGTTDPDVFQVPILRGASVTIQPRVVIVDGTAITYEFASWDDGSTANPRTIFASHDGARTVTMRVRAASDFLVTSLWATGGVLGGLDIRSSPDGSGGMFVSWCDNRGGNFDVYVQRVAATGQIAPGWPATGVPVCTAAGDQRRVVMTADNSGGCFLAWEDGRGEGAWYPYTLDMYAQHITGVGTVAAGWPANGAPVAVLNNVVQWGVTIAADESGNLLLVWVDGRDPSYSCPYAQKLIGSTGQPAWVADGVRVADLPIKDPDHIVSRDQFLTVIPGGSGSAIVQWVDPYGSLYIQKLAAADGAPQWALGYPGAIALDDGVYQAGLLASPAGGFHTVYARWVGSGWTDTDLFYGRLDSTGTFVPGHPVAACNAPGVQRTAQLTSDGWGGVLAAWIDERGGGQDVYATRYDANGVRASCYPANGLAVATGGNLGELAVAGDGWGGMTMVWNAADDIKGRHVFSDATLGSPITFSSATYAQMTPTATLVSSGKTMSAWLDARSGAVKEIYGQAYAFTEPQPAGITSLAIQTVASSGISLTWTVPPDHPAYGPAVGFDLRYSSDSITEGSFNSLPAHDLIPPDGPPGTPQCFSAEPLARCRGYTFAMRVRYGCGAVSLISNTRSATTRCSGYSLPDCGGGGFRAQRPVDEASAAPTTLEFALASANPAPGGVMFRLAIPTAEAGQLLDVGIFDVAGRRVQTLQHTSAEVGRFTQAWDGRDQAGGAAPAGIYFARCTVGDRRISRTIVLGR